VGEVKITVVLNEAGKVIAAHVPVAGERGPESSPMERDAPMTAFVPSAGQEVVEMDLAEGDVPFVPREDFLEDLQRRRDAMA
jgi:hypothetical protein